VEGTQWSGYYPGLWGHAYVFEGISALVSGGVEGEGGEYHDEVEGKAGY